MEPISLIKHTSDQVDTFGPALASVQKLRSKPQIHLNVKRKLSDWKLTVTKKKLIVGSCNLARIPKNKNLDLQIDFHAASFIKNSVVTTEVEQVILAFGINHRQ